MKEMTVFSGELMFCHEEPAILNTVVGVCIAVCLWDRKTKRGGLCHYRLPIANDKMGQDDKSYEFGKHAIITLLKMFKRHGSSVDNLQAKILGGGDLHYGEFMHQQQIGKKNIDVALQVLAQFGIAVKGKSVGTTNGRRLRFNTETGEVDFQPVNCADFSEQRLDQSQANNGSRKIRVLIIDPSEKMRKRLQQSIEQDSEFVIVAQVANTDNAKSAIEMLMPDVITFDVNMKNTNGPAFISHYMKQLLIPTVIITTIQQQTSDKIFNALKLGAFDYIDKSNLPNLNSTLKAAYQSKQMMMRTQALSTELKLERVNFNEDYRHASLIVLGSSTGGVDALETMIKMLPETTPPICIVQHIPKVYSHSLAQRLNEMTAVSVAEAVDGVEIKNNHVYIARGGHHMKLAQLAPEKLVLRLTDEPAHNGFRPSVDYLFNSAQKLTGWNIVGVLLSGMGRDGAQGLLKLKQHGAYTIVQNEASSVVYGMAKAANEINAVCKTIAIEGIASAMLEASLKPGKKQRVSINNPQATAANVRTV